MPWCPPKTNPPSRHSQNPDSLRQQPPGDRFLILLHIEWRGKPGTMRVDNGPECISGKLLIWAEKQGSAIQHIQPGQPQQNAYIERYNRFRHWSRTDGAFNGSLR